MNQLVRNTCTCKSRLIQKKIKLASNYRGTHFFLQRTLSISWLADIVFSCSLQKYEQIKTEDIPNLRNSEFDPNMVTDIACNILSFLKSNATKEGHTYWLYKGRLIKSIFTNKCNFQVYPDYCKHIKHVFSIYHILRKLIFPTRFFLATKKWHTYWLYKNCLFKSAVN